MSTQPLRNALAIVNPAAGRGRGLDVWQRCDAILREHGHEVEVAVTRSAGHARELAECAARDGRSSVIAVGGDGTVHHVANGLLSALERDHERASTVPLGVIPAGSGNDFIRTLAIPDESVSAARQLLTATPRVVDAGRAGERYFVNGVGIGFDAAVVQEASTISRLRGLPLYLTALFRTLKGYQPGRVEVLLDDAVVADGPVTLVTIGNGPCYGGGFWLCPDAQLDDGKLDVLVADATSRRGTLAFLLRSLRARHRNRSGIHLHRGETVMVRCASPLPVHLDGEVLDGPPTELQVEVLPSRLTVLTG